MGAIFMVYLQVVFRMQMMLCCYLSLFVTCNACMLNMCAEFVEEFGLSFNVKKSVCFVVGKEYGVGGLPYMCIGSQSMAWVKECCYLDVVIAAGKEFCTYIEF